MKQDCERNFREPPSPLGESPYLVESTTDSSGECVVGMRFFLHVGHCWVSGVASASSMRS